jgi:hypothetical protein
VTTAAAIVAEQVAHSPCWRSKSHVVAASASSALAAAKGSDTLPTQLKRRRDVSSNLNVLQRLQARRVTVCRSTTSWTLCKSFSTTRCITGTWKILFHKPQRRLFYAYCAAAAAAWTVKR